MKKVLAIVLVSCIAVITGAYAQKSLVTPLDKQTTVCNPMNLSYRFCLDTPSRREAADPTMIVYKKEYFLFASKSGGYWHSTDMRQWKLITTKDLPIEDYAPTVVVMKDTLYFMASSDHPVIYKTGDPRSGKWEVVNANFPIGMIDPCLFLDDDGRLYFYYGCSNVNPIYGVELDTRTFNPIGTPKVLFNSHKDTFGWERSGDYNELADNPWIEGSWMTKHKGKYYLQYAIPGTQFKSYCDGVYTSDTPLGDYTIAPSNPCSSRPEGFVGGAGHSSTFQDLYGNYWHLSTVTISIKHMFERRLGFFPMFFDKDGELSTYTAFGDYPIVLPRKKISGPEELAPRWMLLSYHKPVEVSSESPGFPKKFAADEDIRTFWSAKTGDKGEWISMDLQQECAINAIQINYAENETQLFGRSPGVYYQYLLEYSSDGASWHTLADKTQSTTDVPHDYLELRTPVKARYIRLTNYRMPSGTFALADLRVFGKGVGAPPASVKKLEVVRSTTDRCIVNVHWEKGSTATGFNIRYGTQKNKLYHTYQVMGADSLTIRSLNSGSTYYFTIDAFNENGVRKGDAILEVK
jgi:hypothetical protein